MKRKSTTILLIVITLALAVSPGVFGHNSKSLLPRTDGDSNNLDGLTIVGEKVNVEGIVIKRDDDTFTLRAPDGTETVVVLTDKTSVKIARRFRPDKTVHTSNIVRGLRLKADGTGDIDGQLIAKNIRFAERDLLTAQALDSRVTPVEAQANSTEILAEANEKRIDYAQGEITALEENAKRLSGQVDELSSVANSAVAAAKNAQATADKAESSADTANDRITSLDEYAVFRTITVHFQSGTASLSPKAKQEIDEAVGDLLENNFKGFAVSVVGFADSTGKTAANRSLSRLRAGTVINYLVTQHNLPLQRLVQPFGYGSLNPVASNKTKTGRSTNRRAEIRILVNKGITQASL